MVRLLCVLVLVTGCLDDRYQCASDADCNVGASGRCEVDHLCTTYDQSCTASNRRYTAHSGDKSSACFDDAIALADPCAPNQRAPTSDACTDSVCKIEPACCKTGWTDTCVELAQQDMTCALKCDTRIAITATSPTTTEVWSLDWNGKTWTAMQQTDASAMWWLGPAPGGTTPRRLKLDPLGTGYRIDDGTPVQLGADHRVQDVATVDFDRDGHDPLAIAYTDAAGAQNLELVQLDSDVTREVGMLESDYAMAWGDYDHNAFPDVAAVFNARFDVVQNGENDADHTRVLFDAIHRALPGNGLGFPDVPGARTVEWSDFDNDTKLDLVMIGTSVRMNLGAGLLDSVQLTDIDCDPPSIANQCPAMQDDTKVSYAGCAVADAMTSSILYSVQPVGPIAAGDIRNLHRTKRAQIDTVAKTVTSDVFSFAQNCGNPCEPLLAIAVRDLDGDHKLDIIALDATLHLYVALSTKDLTKLDLVAPQPINSQVPFTAIRVSVSGVKQ